MNQRRHGVEVRKIPEYPMGPMGFPWNGKIKALFTGMGMKMIKWKWERVGILFACKFT